MTEEKIGGRPVTIIKEDGKIKVVFHPMAKGVKNPNGSQYCNSCGTKIENACPQCSNINPSGSSFCNKCGFVLQ